MAVIALDDGPATARISTTSRLGKLSACLARAGSAFEQVDGGRLSGGVPDWARRVAYCADLRWSSSSLGTSSVRRRPCQRSNGGSYLSDVLSLRKAIEVTNLPEIRYATTMSDGDLPPGSEAGYGSPLSETSHVDSSFSHAATVDIEPTEAARRFSRISLGSLNRCLTTGVTGDQSAYKASRVIAPFSVWRCSRRLVFAASCCGSGAGNSRFKGYPAVPGCSTSAAIIPAFCIPVSASDLLVSRSR